MKILIASSIDPAAIDKLSDQHDVVCAIGAAESDLKSQIVDREVLIFRSGVQITAEVMANAPDLRLILRAGSGYDNIDLEHVRQRKIRFVRVPGPSAQAVAEMSFALMLALARKVVWADHQWRAGHWVKREATGHMLQGKTLGIVGAGNIGGRTGELGAAWGMRVMGCVDPATSRDARQKEKNIQLADYDQVLSEADFLSIHVPLQDSTRNLVDAAALALMKPEAFLVNLARGGVVDEAALYEALVSGRLAGAALDVHENEGEGCISPLAGLENVILTPHIGANTVDSQREIGRVMVAHVDEAVANSMADTESDIIVTQKSTSQTPIARA